MIESRDPDSSSLADSGTTQCVAPKPNRWRRRFLLLLAAWVLSTFLLSFPMVRSVVAYPLVVHNSRASGDAAYVMADGSAYWERLRAASDLYHMKRVPRIVILNERESAGYCFVRKRSIPRVERVIEYLGLYGVPKEKISTIDVELPATFGSLSEARAVAKAETGLKRIVVVTSPPHTRRSQLCFRRSLPEHVQVQICSATEPSHSAEIRWPIWMEYVKLAVYYVVA